MQNAAQAALGFEQKAFKDAREKVCDVLAPSRGLY